MILFETIIPRAPATHNHTIRKWGRRVYVEERTTWLQYLQTWRHRMQDHAPPLWWTQAGELEKTGELRPVFVKIVAVYPVPVDFDAAMVKPLIDCLGTRVFQRGRKKSGGSDEFQGVGVLIDDGPKYIPTPLVVHSIRVKGHSATFVRIRDAGDFLDKDRDMEARLEGGGEIIGADHWWT